MPVWPDSRQLVNLARTQIGRVEAPCSGYPTSYRRWGEGAWRRRLSTVEAAVEAEVEAVDGAAGETPDEAISAVLVARGMTSRMAFATWKTLAVTVACATRP